ncbi:MAG: nucleotidyl transferase AbiEii/AbiGii toxin family protein, partial [Methylotenera sp.]
MPQWSLGGGTVLMFHYQHRLSKDIDIFIPDPQFLGYVNPRLSDTAEQLTQDYDESTEYIKLRFAEGEIDFIATAPLTNAPYFEYKVLGRSIWLETPLEIVAKKMWHRGNKATARDLLDLCLVI